MALETSILTSTKKLLQIGDDDDSFDPVIVSHINSAFTTLNDLGVGPDAGFFIEDDTALWSELLIEEPAQLMQIKTFVYLTVRLLFDPPQTAFLQTAMQGQLTEMTSRISMRRENAEWAQPVDDLADVIDGGDAG